MYKKEAVSGKHTSLIPKGLPLYSNHGIHKRPERLVACNPHQTEEALARNAEELMRDLERKWQQMQQGKIPVL